MAGHQSPCKSVQEPELTQLGIPATTVWRAIPPKGGLSWLLTFPVGWALPHYNLDVRKFLGDQLTGSWRERGGPTLWPPRPPDLGFCQRLRLHATKAPTWLSYWTNFGARNLNIA